MTDVAALLKEAGYFMKRDPQPGGPFEIGLVLAGAVSAGAYTGGVIDFLIEALDAWEQAKAEDAGQATIPPHAVRLRVIAGASAGSVCGATAAVALRYDFAHVRMSTPQADRDDNPFYQAWVTSADIKRLLDPGDLQPGRKIGSLLNSQALVKIKDDVIGFDAAPRIAPEKRPYLADGLRIVMTVGNLRGTPYFISFNRPDDPVGDVMTVHRDYRGFVMQLGAQAPGTRPGIAKADDVLLPDANSSTDPVWDLFGVTALGSAAFPVGLAPQVMSRPYTDYRYRFAVIPGDGVIPTQPVALIPAWSPSIDTSGNALFKSYVVDGGTMNNEPLDLARIELAGLCGRNPRDGTEACRALLMVDPFPDKSSTADTPDAGGDVTQGPDLVTIVQALFGAWIAQSRYSIEDIALAMDETIFSRFLIAPRRYEAGALQDPAIACGLLGGFSGFLSEAYRRHDYLLGRRNCQAFLRKVFVLPKNNPLFTSWTNEADKQRWIAKTNASGRVEADDGQNFLPIIPLVGALDSDEEPEPAWPVDQIDLDELDKLIKARLDALVPRVVEMLGVHGVGAWLIDKTVPHVLARALGDKAVDIVEQALKQGGLLTR